MGVYNYETLKEHFGHKIVCVSYASGTEHANVALECEDCHEVLVDYNKIEEPEAPNRVAIILDGGLVQNVLTDQDCLVTVVDYDTDGADPSDTQSVLNSSAYVTVGYDNEVSSEELDKLEVSIKKGAAEKEAEEALQEFSVPVKWEMESFVKVKASSLEEAMQAARDEPLPENPDFVEGSFEVQIAFYEQLHEEEEAN